MFKYSTKDFNAMLAALDTQHTNGVIELYTGAQPASPDDAATGTLIGTATKDAGAFTPGTATNGLNFAAPVLNAMSKEAAETWKFTAVAAGTIGWGRLKGNGTDAGGSSTALPRIDFTVGITSGDARTSKVTYAIGEIGTVDSFTITQTNN
ncbi:MAG: hypothetical protein PHT88_04800 [Candidatus Moranbacteria bacterium]|nr:hypothetical protein [Candidatus Moranbacteria bacterium]